MNKVSEKIRLRVNVNGRVQGVGFRPTVYRYAGEKKLSGWVRNDSDGVIIEVEGERESVDGFIKKLKSFPPPQADIKQISISVLPLRDEKSFQIVSSSSESEIKTEVSPDIAACSECLRELLDPNDRRFLYPFINCTNCGPRLTIVENIPYDRERTTMDKFIMCLECSEEYHNPYSRRFHAQPDACPDCGPQVSLVRSQTTRVSRGYPEVQSSQEEAVKETIKLLKEGKIVAIKGLGGFHLACDATNDEAVGDLRKRKSRENKPFALMAKDVEVIKRFCEVSPEEEQLLLSPKRPIVLLRKIQNSGSGIESSKGKDISEKVAPDNKYLGFMLPYTPLHYLLFNAQSNLSNFSILLDSCPPAGEAGRGRARQGDSLSVLVMTSGNFSDEPIIHRNEDAFVRLKDIADFILVHNRDIFVQCDDSVARVFQVNGDEIIVRRARGYVPEPIKVQLHHAHIASCTADSGVNNSIKVQGLEETSILATGTHLKNTFCLAKGNQFIMSQHIGDLENFETFETFENTIEHFKKLFRIAPSVIACDLHPEYLATKYAVEHTSLNPDIRLVKVQHHHAHIASCMADNDMENHEVIGVAFDGTGFGSDGRLWGGEFLVADYTKFERIAHLKYFRLPGGEKAIKEPWRIAVSLLYERFGENFLELGLDFTKRLDKGKSFFLREMLDKGINCPYTSSIGRLFDAVSSLVGLREKVTYEGEAAIELEMAIRDERAEGYYKYEVQKENNAFTIDYSPIVEGVVGDLKNGESVSVISQKFHNTVAELILKACGIIRSDFQLSEVVLSGGVFQNMFLLRKAYRRLTESGFKVYVNRRVPTNDGGVSLGQAIIASYGR